MSEDDKEMSFRELLYTTAERFGIDIDEHYDKHTYPCKELEYIPKHLVRLRILFWRTYFRWKLYHFHKDWYSSLYVERGIKRNYILKMLKLKANNIREISPGIYDEELGVSVRRIYIDTRY